MKTFNQFTEDMNELIKGAFKQGTSQFLNSKAVKGSLKDLSKGNLSIEKIQKVGQKRGDDLKSSFKSAVGGALTTVGKGMSK